MCASSVSESVGGSFAVDKYSGSARDQSHAQTVCIKLAFT